MLRCRVLGHRYDFKATGSTLSWSCERACGARAFDREDRATSRGHAPPLGMFPLWIVRAIRARRERPASG
jgi:hypothetical protein